ncbi:MAG: family 16 glycosylhydrolase [Rhodobacteraceae bacterium]|nr:family 16 glycosylhydrolase [Paracoccaceae bacterium]
MALGLGLGLAGGAARAEGPDLTATIPILDTDFAEGLHRYDGLSGVWSTLPRRRQLLSNAGTAAFWDTGTLPPDAEAAITPTVAVTPEGLSLRTVPVPASALDALRGYLARTTRDPRADGIAYLTGQINTHQTWAQQYGYFEITARIPRGKGRWPAFWLTSAALGWPPEIDIFEAYGKGIERTTRRDHRFNVAVHFDDVDMFGQSTLETDLVNPFAEVDGQPERPNRRDRPDGPNYAFQRHFDAARAFDADIYDAFHTYAALWTPSSIRFYFGPDPASLREIYRTPTPPDAQSPMYLIANDQFTTRGGWWEPFAGMAGRVAVPENDLAIRRIVVRALLPDAEIGAEDADPGDSVLRDTSGDDTLYPGTGFDVIALQGGADRIVFQRGPLPKVIAGFGPDDVAELIGYPFDGAADVLRRLTQVGADVWLPSGADPANPQTLVFRDARVADFSARQFDLRWPRALDIWAGDAARPTVAARPDAGATELRAPRGGGKLNDGGTPVTLIGSAAPDHFTVSHPATRIDEPARGGIDTMVALVSADLPAHIEHGIAMRPGVVLRGTPGRDRLQAARPGVTLDGRGGGDLYEIDPQARATIRIGKTPGHDLVVGLKPDDRIDMARTLSTRREEWWIEPRADALRLWLGPDQSLEIAGDPAALERRFFGAAGGPRRP